jgi:hypothetical protein
MPKIDKDYWEGLYNPAMRHCLACIHRAHNINDEPCTTCLHSGEFPGRDRPLWESREGKAIPVQVAAAATKVELGGQLRLF